MISPMEVNSHTIQAGSLVFDQNVPPAIAVRKPPIVEFSRDQQHGLSIDKKSVFVPSQRAIVTICDRGGGDIEGPVVRLRVSPVSATGVE